MPAPDRDVSVAATQISQLLLGDVRKVDCDIIESHVRPLVSASYRAGMEAAIKVIADSDDKLMAELHIANIRAAMPQGDA